MSQPLAMTRQQIYDEYIKYLDERFRPGNGDHLLRLEESALYYDDFLKDMGLPEDTELPT